MHLFLTSSPCDDHVPEGVALPCILNEANRFVENLRARFVPGSSCVLIAASPEAYELNDEMAETFAAAFAWHGMEFSDMTLIDWRTANLLPEALAESGVVILGGGHVPTQHAFFEALGLRELLQGYEGIVMGISAGTMNCCDEVYAQPEECGEAVDPEYERFFPGLALTDVMVLPHYQKVRDYWLDGMRLFEDITYGDSFGREFFALVDGSYILIENSHATLYGESYRISNAVIEQIADDGDVVEIR